MAFMSQLTISRFPSTVTEEPKPKPKPAKVSLLKRLQKSSVSTPPETKLEEFTPFDASIFHTVDADNLPPARAAVPVTINYDWGDVECEMVAGVIGMAVSSTGQCFHAREEKGLDCIEVVPGWWIEEKGRTSFTS